MVVFSSCEAAMKEGFGVYDFDNESKMYIVVKDFQRGNARVRMLALARH